MNKIAYNFCSFAVKNTKNALKMSKFPLNISLSAGLGRAWPMLVGLGRESGVSRAWSGSLLGGWFKVYQSFQAFFQHCTLMPDHVKKLRYFTVYENKSVSHL